MSEQHTYEEWGKRAYVSYFSADLVVLNHVRYTPVADTLTYWSVDWVKSETNGNFGSGGRLFDTVKEAQDHWHSIVDRNGNFEVNGHNYIAQTVVLSEVTYDKKTKETDKVIHKRWEIDTVHVCETQR